jgi:hypothetical protein
MIQYTEPARPCKGVDALWAEYQATIAAIKPDRYLTVKRASVAWDCWLAAFIPNEHERHAVPRPRMIGGSA